MGPDVIAAVTEIAARQHGASAPRSCVRPASPPRRNAAPSPSAGCSLSTGPWSSWPGHRTPGGDASMWDCSSLGRPSWVSHEAAAALHGFDRSVPESVEFSVPRSHRGRTCPWPVHTTDDLGPHDRRDRRRAALLDGDPDDPRPRPRASPETPPRGGDRQRGPFGPHRSARPRATSRRAARSRAAGAPLRSMHSWSTPAESPCSSAASSRSSGERACPGRSRRRSSAGDGHHVGRVDFLFREHDVVRRGHGRLGHSTPAERDRDAQRRNELLDLGLIVYEYTWAHVTRRGPWVIETLRPAACVASTARLGRIHVTQAVRERSRSR